MILHAVFSSLARATEYSVSYHFNLRSLRIYLFHFSPSSAGGSNALTVYLVGDDLVGPTPAPTNDVGGPTPAPTPAPSLAPTTDVEGPQYGELGCAEDLTTGVRVRHSVREAGDIVRHSSGTQVRDEKYATRNQTDRQMEFLLKLIPLRCPVVGLNNSETG